MTHENEGIIRVSFANVERVHIPEGSYSIYQFSAEKMEDIELAISTFRDAGVVLSKPGCVYPNAVRPFFKHSPTAPRDHDNFGITVYLAGPIGIDLISEDEAG